jgi:hypothetical protein
MYNIGDDYMPEPCGCGYHILNSPDRIAALNNSDRAAMLSQAVARAVSFILFYHITSTNNATAVHGAISYTTASAIRVHYSLYCTYMCHRLMLIPLSNIYVVVLLLTLQKLFLLFVCAQMQSSSTLAADNLILGMSDNSILAINAVATTGASAVTVETREFSHLLTSQTVR